MFKKVYIEIKKLFLIRKIYLANPLKEKQEQVVQSNNETSLKQPKTKKKVKEENKVIKTLGYNLSEVIIIGDQLYTDILVGNRVGIKTVLVNPMSKDDLLFTKIFRFLERRKFKKFAKMGILKKGKYYE